jgi:predicted MPP superfamily phosphohydrolase
MNPHTYYVLGNREWRNGNINSFLNGLNERKVMILNNTNIKFPKENFITNLCGIDDPYTGVEDVEKAFDGIDTKHFTILLSHSPDIIMKESHILADLILCGHTHGGQVRLPFIGAVIAPRQGFFPVYDKGLFDIDTDTKLYIDSGLGNSLLPLRFWNRSQMSFITIIGE